MEVQKSVLPNGLRLVTANIPGIESVTCLVLTAVGSRYESREKLGISHVLEHMTFKGTKKRPKALDINKLVDGVGGSTNAFTDKEFTGYWIKLASEHTDLALDILSDNLFNSLFEPKELTKEIGVVMEEAKMRRDNPTIHTIDSYFELVLGDQPLGWDTIGTTESLRSISRNDVAKFVSTFYKPENMVIAIAGKLGPDIGKKVEHYFGGLNRAKTPTYQVAKLAQSQPQVRLQKREIEQANLVIGVEGVSRPDQDFFPLSVMEAVLGPGMSSRLWQTIREKKGLAYTVRPFSESYYETGVFGVYAGVDPSKADEAIKAVLSELGKLTTTKVPAEELTKAKEFLKGQIKLSLEGTQAAAENFGLRELLEKRILTVEQLSSLIDRVTEDDILRVATRIFRTEKLNLSLIGPFSDENRFLKLLKV